MERVLITGADGFVGGHLVSELSGEWSSEILGIGLRKNGPEEQRASYRVLDITDYDDLKELLDEFAPDAVFHLAAQPSVALSWKDPWSTYRVNLFGQLNLLEAIRRAGLGPSFLVTCSSEEYGPVGPGDIPLVEGRPLRPSSHYAVSKVAQENLATMYSEAYGWRILVTRGFNQAGPGQSPNFVVSDFARQIADIERGKREPVLRVGNLEARRDFVDVRDTVSAYRLVMEGGTPGTPYNVCSGRPIAIKEILRILLELSTAEIQVEKDPARDRPTDIPVLAGDNEKIKSELGWEPRIPLERTLRDVLDYWRETVG